MLPGSIAAVSYEHVSEAKMNTNRDPITVAEMNRRIDAAWKAVSLTVDSDTTVGNWFSDSERGAIKVFRDQTKDTRLTRVREGGES